MKAWVISNYPREDDVAEKEIPDVYCDQFSLAQSTYGIAFTFALSQTNPPTVGPPTPQPQVIVRMSLEHAKVMAMMVRRHLKQYELEHLGDPIRLPKDVLAGMKLSDADW